MHFNVELAKFLTSFKEIHEDYLSGYIAIFEFIRNLKRMTSDFIPSLVALYTLCR